MPTPCLTKLTYTAELVRLGYLDYTYRIPRNGRGIVFKVEVKDNQRRTYWYFFFHIVTDYIYKNEQKKMLFHHLKK